MASLTGLPVSTAINCAISLTREVNNAAQLSNTFLRALKPSACQSIAASLADKTVANTSSGVKSLYWAITSPVVGSCFANVAVVLMR